jgi:hypothetical protein
MFLAADVAQPNGHPDPLGRILRVEPQTPNDTTSFMAKQAGCGFSLSVNFNQNSFRD